MSNNKNNASTNSSNISTNNDSINLDENNSNFILNDDHFSYLNAQQKPMLIKQQHLLQQQQQQQQQQGFNNKYGDDTTIYDNCTKHDYNNYYSYLNTLKSHNSNNNIKSLIQNNNKNISTISSTATLSTNLTNANNRHSQTQFQSNNWNISNCFNDSTKTLPASSPIPNAAKFKTPINMRTITTNNVRTPSNPAFDDTPPFTVNNISNYAYTNYQCYTPDDDNDEMFNSRRSFNTASYTRSYNVRNSTAINKCILQQSSAGESSSSISTPSEDLPSDYVNHQNMNYFNTNTNTATINSSDGSRSNVRNVINADSKPVWVNKNGQYSKYEYLSDVNNQNSFKYIDDEDHSYSVYSKYNLTKLTQNSMNANINRKQQQYNLFNKMSRIAANQRIQQLPMLTPLYDDYLCDKEVEGYFDNPVYFDCYNTTNKITNYGDINEQKNLIQLLNAISNSSNSNGNSNNNSNNNKRCKGESYC